MSLFAITTSQLPSPCLHVREGFGAARHDGDERRRDANERGGSVERCGFRKISEGVWDRRSGAEYSEGGFEDRSEVKAKTKTKLE